MGIQRKQSALLVLMGLVLSSCYGNPLLMMAAGSRKKSASVQIAPSSQYVKASCEYKAEDGAPAPQSLPSTDFVTTYFGKKYDKSLLDAILASSAIETVRFAELTNVQFYSVPRFDPNSCLMSSFIPEAPTLYESKFTSLGKGVLGLYLAPKNSLVQKANDQATILVRRDANRWVLVHEFMHHLFSKEVQDNGLNDEELNDQYQQANDQLKTVKAKYTETKSLQDGQKMLNTAKTLVTLAPELLKRFTLEEMAIESVLWSRLSDSSFKNVPRNQAINGAAYIYTSANKAEYHLLRFSLEAMHANLDTDFLQEKLKAEDYENYKSTFTAAKKKIDSYVAELRSLKAAAGQRLRDAGIDPETDLLGYLDVYDAALTQQSGANQDHVGCAHSKDLDAFKSF